MKKIVLILIALTFLISLNVAFADDMNTTDVSSSVDNVTSPDNTLKSQLNSSDVLTASKSSKVIDNSKTVKAKDLTKYYKGNEKYRVTFYNKNGMALKNVKVKLTVNNKIYNVKTNKKGKAVLKINLRPGNYKVTAHNPETGFKLTTNIKVLSTIESKDLTKVYRTNNKFKVKFLNSKGKPLANKKVSYEFNGTKYTNRTNKKGFIVFSTKNFKKGKYKFKFYHPNGLKRTNVVRVVKSAETKIVAGDYCFLKSSYKVVKVRLADQFGYKVKGKTIKAKVNGKTFKAKTDSKGIAKIRIKIDNDGVQKINYIFTKNGYYKSSKTTGKAYVFPSKNPTFTVKGTKTFGYNAHTEFKLQLTSGNMPIFKKTVIFKIKGKTYKRMTDNEGMVSLPIDLAIGKYTIKSSVKKDSLFNAKSFKTKITVKPRIKTYLSWVGNTSFYQGLQKCQVQLKDSDNKLLAGKVVCLNINSRAYTATTSSKGIATFDVIVPPGNYHVSLAYNGDNDYDIGKNKVKINATYKVIGGNGYWLKKEQFESVSFENLTSLAQQGVTDIFLSSDSIAAFGKERVESWIANATGLSMKVHLWVTVFKDTNNNVWTNAMEKGGINYGFFTQKINEIREFSQISGIAGIHLDYLRVKNKAYKTPGSTDAINLFVKQVTGAIRDINKELIISCAVTAKLDDSIYFHAQNFTFISQYMDVVMPMVYKGNYGQTASWITSTTRWYIEHSLGAKIWTGLQTYKSDSDITVLSENEMKQDAQAAIDGGAAGLVLFRWGLTSYIDFNVLKGES